MQKYLHFVIVEHNAYQVCLSASCSPRQLTAASDNLGDDIKGKNLDITSTLTSQVFC